MILKLLLFLDCILRKMLQYASQLLYLTFGAFEIKLILGLLITEELCKFILFNGCIHTRQKS